MGGFATNGITKDVLRAAEPMELSQPALACAERILDSIHSGQWKSPQRIGEASLAQQWGVGRAHVRAALDHLAHVGILDRRARSGTYVRKVSLTEYVQRIGFRAALEGLVVREACFRATPSQLKQLQHQAQRIDSRDLKQFVPFGELCDADMAFHMAICQIAGNAFVESQLRSQRFLLRCFADSRVLNLPPLPPERLAVPQHGAIAAAIAQAEADEAERVLRTHILGSTYFSLTSFRDPRHEGVRLDHASEQEIARSLERLRTWLGDSFRGEA